MKRILFMLSLTGIVLAGYTQENGKEGKVKTGWNFGALPTITYNTDLGFQYGALVNFFYYGDGTVYPKYLHNIYVEASQFTKGSAIYRISYDSEYLIPGIRVTSDLAYLPDDAFDFYGFNGFEARYNALWEESKNGNTLYKTRMFYKYKNQNFRFKTDIQFPIAGESLLGLVGFNAQYYQLATVDIAKFNKGKEENDPTRLPAVPTLFDEYISAGLISADEANGGFVPLLKAGVVYDSRDNEPNPMKGIWTEAFLFGAPGFLGAESGFAKLNITHRQYFTLVKRDLSFAYQIAYQGTLFGETPFYYQTQIETSLMKDQLGIGGSKTVRGINRNRVVSDGFVYANIELRWKVVHFRFINQNFYIGLNGFMDAGQVVQKMDIRSKVEQTDYFANPSDYFDFEKPEKPHIAYGAGLRIVMNENFVISCDYGQAVDPQDGTSELYIGLNYLF
ncbi:MAG TPA: BamA/TamA family outer membrane protein [Prolixibacteraceae bacterium]|nr:BamA/TamA family outer membrane protein [Prolixibacteraceae bacterium]